MEAVLETYDAAGFTAWPVAAPSADRLLALSGRMSPEEVGTAMAVLVTYNTQGRLRRAHARRGGARRIRRLVEAECVIAPGGLRVRDGATGVTAAPGCCFGLEDWRDWLGLSAGRTPWLGHSPSPRVEHDGTLARLWPDEDRTDGPAIPIPLAQLPELLEAVRADLRAFLALAGEWAAGVDPALAPALTAKLDQDLAISAPL